MAVLNLGKVRGDDGFSPAIDVLEDTPASYRLSIQDKTHTIISPNLRGITARRFEIAVEGSGAKIIAMPDLGLDSGREYAICASPMEDCPLLRNVTAVRVGNAIRVSVYHDTLPYAEPRIGSPHLGGAAKIGTVGMKIGGFKTGEMSPAAPFMVSLLCFEITPDG